MHCTYQAAPWLPVVWFCLHARTFFGKAKIRQRVFIHKAQYIARLKRCYAYTSIRPSDKIRLTFDT